MKILHVVHNLPSFHQSGTELYAYTLARELARRHQVFIFSRIKDASQPEYHLARQTQENLNVYTLNNTLAAYRRFEDSYTNGAVDRAFAAVLEESRPDAVHIHHLASLSIGIIQQAKQKNIPVVCTLHDYWFICPQWHMRTSKGDVCRRTTAAEFNDQCQGCFGDSLFAHGLLVRAYQSLRKVFPVDMLVFLRRNVKGFVSKGNIPERLRIRHRSIRNALEGVDIFFAPSQTIQERFVRAGIAAEKIFLSRYGIVRQSGTFPQRAVSSKLRFSFIGTLLPAKGVDIMIEAFRGLSGYPVELRIYGKRYAYAGYERFLRQIERRGCYANILFMGELPHERISEAFADTDLLVVPSTWQENAPLVIQEAFAYKIPVIASRIGGIPEFVQDGVNGLLCEAGDSSNLREKMEEVCRNPSILEKFKQNIPEVKGIVENAYELEGFYQGLMAARR
ncbi:MAG: glycosyltransferase family 4 protein [Candidatus Omnitrophica bacterium]|nr:glycosyltransferase family 4 protein [Candidatus Omnitrophota bacterium]